SKLEEQIIDLVKQGCNPLLATYIYESSVILRITGKGKNRDQVQQKIDQCKKEVFSRIGEYCYSEQKEKIEETVVRTLRNHNKTVACGESCTGGCLAHLVSTVPGSSAGLCGGLISYTTQAKAKLNLVTSADLKTNGCVHWATAK